MTSDRRSAPKATTRAAGYSSITARLSCTCSYRRRANSTTSSGCGASLRRRRKGRNDLRKNEKEDAREAVSLGYADLPHHLCRFRGGCIAHHGAASAGHTLTRGQTML